MTRLRFKPCQQGNLDGLCGLYALVNALRCLCPKADQAACERVFAVLIRALGRHHRSPLAVIHRGLNRYELLRLAEAWQRFAAREFGITRRGDQPQAAGGCTFARLHRYPRWS